MQKNNKNKDIQLEKQYEESIIKYKKFYKYYLYQSAFLGNKKSRNELYP